MGRVRYFWHSFIDRDKTFMYLQYSASLIYQFCQIFGSRRTPSAHQSFFIFRIDCSIAQISSFLVLYRVPCSGSFTLTRRSQSHGLISGEYGGCFRISHSQRRKRSVTAAAVWLLALSWRMMGFSTTKCRRFLLSAKPRWCAGTYSSKQRLPSALEIQHGAVSMSYVTMNITSTAHCVGAHFLWTRRTGMLPLIWLAFQIWFVWASPGFVHSDDSSKKVVRFPLVTVQQGLYGCISVPQLHLGNFMVYPTRYEFVVTQNVVQNVEHSFVI